MSNQMSADENITTHTARGQAACQKMQNKYAENLLGIS